MSSDKPFHKLDHPITDDPGMIVYSSDEAAFLLRISLRKLREMARTGELHALPYATGKLLFSREELRRLMGLAP